jgi:hypothetical protein
MAFTNSLYNSHGILRGLRKLWPIDRNNWSAQIPADSRFFSQQMSSSLEALYWGRCLHVAEAEIRALVKRVNHLAVKDINKPGWKEVGVDLLPLYDFWSDRQA